MLEKSHSFKPSHGGSTVRHTTSPGDVTSYHTILRACSASISYSGLPKGANRFRTSSAVWQSNGLNNLCSTPVFPDPEPKKPRTQQVGVFILHVLSCSKGVAERGSRTKGWRGGSAEGRKNLVFSPRSATPKLLDQQARSMA